MAVPAGGVSRQPFRRFVNRDFRGFRANVVASQRAAPMLFNIAGLAPLVRRARIRYLLLCGGMFIGLVLAAGAALLVVSLRRNAIAESAKDLKNLALVLDEEIDRSFQTVQLAQNAMIEHMRELGIDTPEKFDSRMASLEVNQNLDDRIAGLPSTEVSHADRSAWPTVERLAFLARTGHRCARQGLLSGAQRGPEHHVGHQRTISQSWRRLVGDFLWPSVHRR